MNKIMTQEENELLLKDLCARLPYNPMVEYNGETYNVLGITHERLVLCKAFMSHTLDECPLVKEVKPFLFPISSMSADQKREYARIVVMSGNIATFQSIVMTVQDWFSKNNIDYRGFIPMGLALDATNLNIYKT